MSADEIIEWCKSKGYTVSLNGEEIVLSPANNTILERLNANRDAIVSRLAPETTPTVELKWGGNGYTCPHWFPEQGIPAGARYRRPYGDTEAPWEPIPESEIAESLIRARRAIGQWDTVATDWRRSD